MIKFKEQKPKTSWLNRFINSNFTMILNLYFLIFLSKKINFYSIIHTYSLDCFLNKITQKIGSKK